MGISLSHVFGVFTYFEGIFQDVSEYPVGYVDGATGTY